MQNELIDKFVRYVKIDTQSDVASTTVPSTMKQKDLGSLLVKELTQMGIADAEMDEKGYVYATIPSNTNKQVPVICFCAHMDTSPDASGKNVNPVLHRNYDGGDLRLPHNNIVLTPIDHPDLKAQKGQTIITADGTTLLGADNKAGVAEIMVAAEYFMNHPEVKHGDIRILFTPDEEIGRGADHVDIDKLGADFGYTVDGETLGSMEDETFSADGVSVVISGVSAHPGFALGKLENALKIASDFISALPKDGWSPETTSGREGFVHPVSVNAIAEEAKIEFIIRSFEDSDLQYYEAKLEGYLKEVMKNYPGSTYTFTVTEQYRNMKNVLSRHPHVADYAAQAIERAGLELKRGSIRGGTDGSKLSFMGLPCPNIFAGEHAFHGKYEWVSVGDMEKAVEVIVNIAKIAEEQA
jgi:tripeptide aminopeptidase